MEVKLFGKSLFSYNKRDALIQSIGESAKESKYLPDFYKGAQEAANWGAFNELVVTSSGSILASNPAMPAGVTTSMDIAPAPKKEEKKKHTPKEVHEMQMLNDKSFKLNLDPEYVKAQLEAFKDKLSLVKSEEYDMRRGVDEINSILVRLENRTKYSKTDKFFEQFPYTTSSKISALTKEHDHLKLGQIAQFVADMPKEAVDAMKQYNEATKAICDKQAVFYIIADKKDFQKTDSRRDPILLAQSPFGHFWQIIGAWDKEMMFLEEL